MNIKKFTYQKSGVNITAADKFVEFISKKANRKKMPKNLKISAVLVQYQIYQKNIKIPKLLQVQMELVLKSK